MKRNRFFWQIPFAWRAVFKRYLLSGSSPHEHPRARGYSLEADLKKLFKQAIPKNPVIFDVGANLGQSAESYIAEFRSCEIFCFEPVDSSFGFLSRRVNSCPQISLHKLAFGAEDGWATIEDKKLSGSNRIVEDINPATTGFPTVKVRRGDNFCDNYGLHEIFILKIDTEGYDLEVLKGFSRMLEQQAAAFVQIEASMAPENKHHVSAQQFTDHLYPLGYRLFGIYDQWAGREGQLRRANLVYVAKKYLESLEKAGH